MTMAALARFLPGKLKQPAEDLTGLTSNYDVDLEWVPDLSANSDSDLARTDIFTAIRNSLGLRLQPRREQVEIIAIDHIERVPIGN